MKQQFLIVVNWMKIQLVPFWNILPKTEKHIRLNITIQNKFHYAISGQTAAEIIYEKVDISQPFMGLQTWKNSPHGRILKSDTVIAKNYLTNRILIEKSKKI